MFQSLLNDTFSEIYNTFTFLNSFIITFLKKYEEDLSKILNSLLTLFYYLYIFVLYFTVIIYVSSKYFLVYFYKLFNNYKWKDLYNMFIKRFQHYSWLN